MKKIITVVFLFMGLSIFAQQKGETREERSSEEMATLMAKRLSMQLDLNEEQQEKLTAFYLKRIEARKAMAEKRSEMRQERMEMSEEQKQELKQILTEEQFQKYTELQEKRRRGRQTRMKN